MKKNYILIVNDQVELETVSVKEVKEFVKNNNVPVTITVEVDINSL